MATLGLDAARAMQDFVESILAIPLLITGPSGGEPRVTGVLYLDSEVDQYFSEDKVETLVAMATDFLRTLASGELASPGTSANVVVNSDFWVGNSTPIEIGPESVPSLPEEFEELSRPAAPTATGSYVYLNLDFSDFEPVEFRQ